jgi:hypothetical protein
MKTTEDALFEHVSYFTNYSPNRHFGNLSALNQCADDLQKFFEEIGLSTKRQTWDARGNEYHNIIGSLYSEKKKRLIVGVHYDVYADNPGADDNASGMAGLLEAAKLISHHKPELAYGIDFVAYCLEEPPFYGTADMGSYVHAQSIKENTPNVLGMICFDMIGYFSEEPKSQRFPNEQMASMFPSVGNFILVVGKAQYSGFADLFHSAMNGCNKMDVQKIIFPNDNELATLSDHRNYWMIGINALMINNTAFLRNPNYHEKTDTIDTLDFPKMKLVVDAAIQGMLCF